MAVVETALAITSAEVSAVFDTIGVLLTEGVLVEDIVGVEADEISMMLDALFGNPRVEKSKRDVESIGRGLRDTLLSFCPRNLTQADFMLPCLKVAMALSKRACSWRCCRSFIDSALFFIWKAIC